MSDPRYLETRYSNHYNKKAITLGDIVFKPRELFITRKITDSVNNKETYYFEAKRNIEEAKENQWDKLARHKNNCDGEFTDMIQGMYRFCNKCDWVLGRMGDGEILVMDSEDRKRQPDED